MARISVPSILCNRKRIRIEELRLDCDAYRIHQDQKSCPKDQELDKEKTDPAEEEEEEATDEELDEEEARSPVNYKSISAIFTDPDVLDCGICCEPLTIPVFQCENGHMACSSCCTGFGNKCPFCSFSNAYIRCRAIEKVMESIKTPCKNKQYGCDLTVACSNKKDHESSCPYSPCLCPQSDCGFVSSDKNLYSHFRSQYHCNSMRFTYGESFRAMVDVGQGFLVLEESNERVLFVLSSSKETIGRAIWINCISPRTSTNVIHYDISAEKKDRVLKLQSVVHFTQGGYHSRPTTGVRYFPFLYFDGTLSGNLFFKLCIYKPK